MYDDQALVCQEGARLWSQEPTESTQQPQERAMEGLVESRRRSGLGGPGAVQATARALERGAEQEMSQEQMGALYVIQQRAAAFGFEHEVSADGQIHITSPRGLRRSFGATQGRAANEWMLAESRLDGPQVGVERRRGAPYDPAAKARQIKSDLSLLISNPGANVTFSGVHAYGEATGEALSLEEEMKAARVGGAAFDLLTGPVQAGAQRARQGQRASSGGATLSHPVHPDHHLDKAPDADLASGQPAIPMGSFTSVPALSVEAAPRDLDEEQE